MGRDDVVNALVDGLVDALVAGSAEPLLTERQRAMLAYACKLTHTPGEMTPDDVGALRAHAFTDADVLAIAEVTAYYAYVNRLVDGLGVQLEPWSRDDAES